MTVSIERKRNGDCLSRLFLSDEAPRCAAPHLLGRVLVGLQQPVDELPNHFKGGPVRGLQAPATCHQLIHLHRGEVGLCHVAAVFDHLVEVGIHGNIWVGTLPCAGGEPVIRLPSSE